MVNNLPIKGQVHTDRGDEAMAIYKVATSEPTELTLGGRTPSKVHGRQHAWCQYKLVDVAQFFVTVGAETLASEEEKAAAQGELLRKRTFVQKASLFYALKNCCYFFVFNVASKSFSTFSQSF